MLLLRRTSKTGPFRHFSGHVFRGRNFLNTKSLRIIFFSEISKSAFQKFSQQFKKFFCFWDNCIWIGLIKLSLLRTGYFSSASNVLTSIPKIWHANKRDFVGHNFLASDQWIWQRCCQQCLGRSTILLVEASSEVELFRYLCEYFFGDPNFDNTKSIGGRGGGAFFFPKCLKFNVASKYAAKN